MNIPEGTATQQFTCADVELTAPRPFVEGHVLTEAEANVLNQTFVENLRNNFKKEVVKAKDEAGEGNEPNITALQAALDEYIAGYEFGVRRSGGTTKSSVDPVERLAIRKAEALLKNALKAKGQKATDIEDAQWDQMVEAALAKYPQIREQAQSEVDAAKNLAASIDLGA